MSQLLYSIVVLLCLCECIYCLKDLRSRFLPLSLFLGVGLVYGLVPIITGGNTGLNLVSPTSPAKAGAAAALGTLSLAIGYHLTQRYYGQTHREGLSPGVWNWIKSREGRGVLIRVFYITSVLGTCCIFGRWIILSGSITGIFSMGRLENRLEAGFIGLAFRHGSNLLFVPGFIGVFLGRKYLIAGVCFAIVFATLIFLATAGSRVMPVGIACAPLFAYVISRPTSIRRFVIASIALAALAIFMIGTYEVRKRMSRMTFSETLSEFVSIEIYQDALDRDPLNYNNMLIASVDNFPARHPYLEGAAYRRILFFYVPSKSRPELRILKPFDPAKTFASVVGGRKQYLNLTTLPPSLFGEPYINLHGFPGVFIIMVLTGGALSIISSKISTSPLIWVTIGPQAVGASIAALRGQTYEVLFVLGVSLVLGFVVLLLAGFRPRQVKYYTQSSERMGHHA